MFYFVIYNIKQQIYNTLQIHKLNLLLIFVKPNNASQYGFNTNNTRTTQVNRF
jgi:hypothetical protein